MPNPDPTDDPEGEAADRLIAEIERLRAATPTPPPEPVVVLPAPPPGSRYVVVGEAFTALLTELAIAAGVSGSAARRRIRAAIAADASAARVAALAQQLEQLPSVTWGSSQGRS
jgi:hypothetical protein